MSKNKKINLQELTEEEKVKYEIAAELGLLDRAGRRGNFYLYVHTTEREVSVP